MKKTDGKTYPLINLLKQAWNFFISFLSKPKCIKSFLSISEIFFEDLANPFNDLVF